MGFSTFLQVVALSSKDAIRAGDCCQTQIGPKRTHWTLGTAGNRANYQWRANAQHTNTEVTTAVSLAALGRAMVAHSSAGAVWESLMVNRHTSPAAVPTVTCANCIQSPLPHLTACRAFCRGTHQSCLGVDTAGISDVRFCGMSPRV